VTGFGVRGPRRMMVIGLLALATGSCSTTTQPSAVPSASGSAAIGPVCAETRTRLDGPGTVAVDMENNPALPAFIASRVYAPADITARVGQTIVFRNADPDEQHQAELVSGACGTDYLDFEKRDSLVFYVPGTYPFYCLVHGTTMAGTITITP
jgi:plastocyanin